MKAKFSLIELIDDSKVAISRFPLVLLSSILSGALGIYAVHATDSVPETLGYLMSVIGLGISLFFAITIFYENNSFNKRLKMLVELLAIACLVLIYFQVESGAEFGFENTILLLFRYAILSHLLVAFLPFILKQNEISFWHYNRIMLIRIILTAVFVVSLYLGLSAAAAAVQTLFGVNIPNQFYFDLMVVLFGPVSVIFFCAGIPKNLSSLEDNQEFPNVIRIFVQFILIPLVLVYLLIMYTYFGKIVIQWNLPKGFLTYFINANLALGILSYLLIFPYKKHAKNKLIDIFLKYFFVVLIPVIGMQMVGIITRLVNYGFTEERYLVLATALWVIYLILYFQFSKKKNTIMIPLSMFVIVFISTIGPISSKSITIISQTHRINKALVDLNMIQNNKLLPFQSNAQDSLKMKKAYQMTKDIEFMVREFGITGAEPYFKVTPNSVIMKKFSSTSSIRSYEIFNVQSDELSKLFEQYKLVNLDWVVDTPLMEDETFQCKIEGIQFPFPITHLVTSFYWPYNLNQGVTASMDHVNGQNAAVLNVEIGKMHYEFDLQPLLNRDYSIENSYVVSTGENKKAVLLIQEYTIDFKQKKISGIRGQLYE